MRRTRPLALFVAALPLACAGNPAGPDVAASHTAELSEDPWLGSPIAAALRRADAELDAICALKDGERTKENTLIAMDDTLARLFQEARMTGFLAQVSPDPEVREVGRRADQDLDEWFNRTGKREDLYRAVRAWAPRAEGLTEAERVYLEDTLRDFRREGMELDAASRGRLLAIDQELNELGQEFQLNIASDETTVLLTPEELAGVPEAVVAQLDSSGGLLLVPVGGPMLGRILGTCEVGSTRLKLAVGASRRAGLRNVEVIEKMIALRCEKARVLGYPTFADYVLEPRMAGSAARVQAFYDDLTPKLERKARADLEELTAAKREHLGDPDAVCQAWDVSFYRNRLMRTRYAVDPEVVREYFPMEAVQAGMFDVYQRLFELRFVDVTERAREAGRPVWHEDVRLYEVHDQRRGEVLGEFYLDLFPRPGKYTHAAQFPLVLRKRWADGRLTRPLVALVCNFTKPTADTPSLMSHGEVETFFHEFGHCLHSILTEVDLASLAGTSVARDFVEAPSQMLENWVWDADVLAGFARHHRTGEPIPRELVEGMIAAKNLGSGLSTQGQLFLGAMDQAFHTDPDGEVDTIAVSEEVYARTRVFEPLPHLYRHADFGHLNGYEAGYYGYLWSLVYASDMFSRFRAEGVMNLETARAYRHEVLSRGGTRDELEMVRAFLGRDPNADAFLEDLGLDQD